MELEAGFREPLAQLLDRALVAVVEVGARGEHFDGVEPVRGDVNEVFPLESRFMEQMRGDAEATLHDRQARSEGAKP